jgi:hypothetical protein
MRKVFQAYLMWRMYTEEGNGHLRGEEERKGGVI